MVEQYLKHSRDILTKGRFKDNPRRGLGRIHLFGYQNRYNLSEGFPLLTTKKLSFKNIAHELMWFLKGDTNIKYLVDNNVHIWDDDAFNYNLKNMAKEGIFRDEFPKFSEGWFGAKAEYVQKIKGDADFAARWGDLGPVYGSQWVHSPKFVPSDSAGETFRKDSNGIDQIARVISGMKKDLTSARHVVSAWNPDEVSRMALPPCHTFFQLNSEGKSLDLQLYQRACDMFLGVPYNIASYSLLTQILAKEIGLKPGEFVHTFGDVHFYSGAGARSKWYKDNLSGLQERINVTEHQDYAGILSWLNGQLPSEDKGREGMDHVTGILEQLQRTPKTLPRLTIADKPYNQLTIDDFVLEGYTPEPTIKRALAV
ncbi:MAG: thymidylate synthase [archaeon]|nr:thymidylate synthase [archaeon]